MTNSDRSATSGLVRLGRLLARRRWVWLPFVIVTPLIVYLSTRTDPPVYRASSQVLLNRQNQVFGGVGDPTVWEPIRSMVTQTTLASLPILGYMVAEGLALRDRDGGAVAGQTSVSPFGDTDILLFTTTDPRPAVARRIATEYAHQFVRFRQQFDTATLGRTIARLDRELRRLERIGRESGALYSDIRSKRRQLTTAVELQKGNALVVRSADTAVRVPPRWQGDALDAFLIALVAGLGLAYVVDVLDRRLRSSHDIAAALDAPLLATVPLPRMRLRRRNRETLVTSTAPECEAEAVRQLRQNVELVSASRRPGVLMLTSVDSSRPSDGIGARLALSLARAGRRVVLVDADLSNPTIHRLFGIASTPGLTDVLLAGADVEDVVQPVLLTRETASRMVSLGPQRAAEDHGRLEVVTTGIAPRDSSEIGFGDVFVHLLAALRARADDVLVEAPPLLTTSDALALARHADAAVLVTGTGGLTLGTAREALKLLERSNTPPLGVVVTEPPGRVKRRFAVLTRRLVPRPA